VRFLRRRLSPRPRDQHRSRRPYNRPLPQHHRDLYRRPRRLYHHPRPCRRRRPCRRSQHLCRHLPLSQSPSGPFRHRAWRSRLSQICRRVRLRCHRRSSLRRRSQHLRWHHHSAPRLRLRSLRRKPNLRTRRRYDRTHYAAPLSRRAAVRPLTPRRARKVEVRRPRDPQCPHRRRGLARRRRDVARPVGPRSTETFKSRRAPRRRDRLQQASSPVLAVPRHKKAPAPR